MIKTIWNEHCLEAIDEYDLSDGILVDEVQATKSKFRYGIISSVFSAL